MIYNSKIDLVIDIAYKILLNSVYSFQDIERNQIQTSIKDRNSIANLREMTLHNPNIGLVNDNEFSNFGKILSIHFQVLGQDQILMSIKGRKSFANLRKRNNVQ